MDKRQIVFLVVLTISFFFIQQDLVPPREYSPPVQAEKEATPPPPMPVEEELYVIQNNYQQLVISSLGGSLSEINLILENKEHPQSIVKAIQYDEILKDDYPQFDRFPLSSYQTYTGKNESTVGGYYPLLRRGIPPQYYGLAVVSDDPALAKTKFKVKRLEQHAIELEANTPKARITKTYSFPENQADAPYCFDVTVKVEGDARGLWITTGVPEVEIVSGSSSPTLKYRISRNNKSSVEKIDLPKTITSYTSIEPDWVCNSNGFFGMILDATGEIPSGFTASEVPGDAAPTRLSLIDSQYQLYPANKYPGYDMRLPLKISSQPITFRVFAGPFSKTVLQQADRAYSNFAEGYDPDYVGALSFHGWFSFISEPFAKFLFFLMRMFHAVTFSWGFSIILLTVALRIMLYPLNAWSLRSTSKMQQIAPLVSALQEKYKKDPKRLQMETMQLYRSKGVNPVGGCLPLLIQMPFLIGMFDLLKSAYDLRGASFIPGWIDNLTAPDVVFSWNYPIWFFGTSFHLLPVFLGAVMYIQQKMSAGSAKGPLTDQQRQQKFMGNIMTVVFTVLFYHFPSGLNLYWLSSMLLGILQQWWTTKKR